MLRFLLGCLIMLVYTYFIYHIIEDCFEHVKHDSGGVIFLLIGGEIYCISVIGIYVVLAVNIAFSYF